MKPEALPLEILAPAKINLFLRVLAREASGYHQLETLFAAVDLTDRIVVEQADEGVSLEVAGSRLGPPEENLVFRAAELFREKVGAEGGLRIRLEKNIPSGAGLGGGSSDAAATLRLLNAAYADPLGEGDLVSLGASLGADIPFFLCGRPWALAWGRGDRLLPSRRGVEATVLLLLPDVHVRTPDAFGALAASGTDYTTGAGVLKLDDLRSLDGLARASGNDFEDVVVGHFSALSGLSALLRDAGAEVSGLSGSGSAFFGVFSDEGAAEQAAATCGRMFPNVRTVQTHFLGEMPEPVPTRP